MVIWPDCDAGPDPALDAVVFLSQVAEEISFACFSNSAVNSWVSLDLRPTLLNGLADTDEDEREERLVLIRSSVFSLRREPALWEPIEAGPFRGIVYRWVGGVVVEDGGVTCLSPVGLELFFTFSSCGLRLEGSGGAMILMDWERFFLWLSSMNSITKAGWGSALARLERDWDSDGEPDTGSTESGERNRCGGEALKACGES